MPLQPRRLRLTHAAMALALVAAAGGVAFGLSGGSSSSAATTSTSGHVHTVVGPDGKVSGQVHTPVVVPPKAVPTDAGGIFDPTRIDLSGVPGVTTEEQARGEDLLRRTVQTLPRWSDPSTAEAEGFQSIGDGFTGHEHLLHWDWIDDATLLDPSHPEALVYRVETDGSRTLEAAMFILPKQYTLANVPDIAGPLTQFHVHDDLCFTPGNAPRVAGITGSGGKCFPPLVKFNPNVMVHVWIRPNACGPFAALEGAGAGQIAPGAARECDHLHSGSF